MSRNIKDISKSNIDKEVYKAYVRLSNCNKKVPLIADIIQHTYIDDIIKQLLPKKYRGIYYSYPSLFRLILFMIVKGLKSQSETVIYLRKHKRERKKLGLKRTPDQAMISKFINHYLTDELKEAISYISNKIIEVAKDLDIELDVINKEKKKKSKRNTGNSKYYIDIEAKRAVRELKKLLLDTKLLKIGQNSYYDLHEYINMLIQLMISHESVEAAAKSYRKYKQEEKKAIMCKNCGKSILYPLKNKIHKNWAMNYLYCPVCGYRDRYSPEGESLLHHIQNKFDSIDEILDHFKILFEKIWHRTKKYNLFDSPVNISIDRTDIPFYGDINTTGIVGKPPKDGTNFGFALYTVYISQYGKRYTLFMLPKINISKGIPESKELRDENKILKELLTFAMKKVKIKHVLLDNGFFNSDSCNLMNELGLKYLTVVKKGQKEKKINEKMDNFPSHQVITDFPYDNSRINLFQVEKIVKVRKKHWKKTKVIWRYATNIMPSGDTKEWVDMMVKLYPKRWGIETSYRVMKEKFYPRTRSKNYIVRLFFFELFILFYNLWVFINIVVFFTIYNNLQKDPDVHAKDFIDLMFYCNIPR